MRRVTVKAKVAKLTGIVLWMLSVFSGSVAAQTMSSRAPAGGRVEVSVPNGYVTVASEDMRVHSVAGPITWLRVWDGKEWRFNPQWESLSQSWRNMTGSEAADTTGPESGSQPTVSMDSSSAPSDGCWVWVDEDWEPTPIVDHATGGGAVPDGVTMIPVRTTPFNRRMGDGAEYPPVTRANVDFMALCPGATSLGGGAELEAMRRLNQLFLGEGGRYAFSNRSVLEKKAVLGLPRLETAVVDGVLASGRMVLAPAAIEKAYLWQDRTGEWISYNNQGQMLAWGDRNNNTNWLLRDAQGVLRAVIDSNGRVATSLHYSGELLTQLRDYPLADGQADLPARTVSYGYDEFNRLTQVVDARGGVTRYGYDKQNRLVKVTDAQGRDEVLSYDGRSVKQRVAPDGGVTDYLFDYDDVNKQFVSRVSEPAGVAGRRTEVFTHNRVGKLVRRVVNGRVEEEVRRDTGARSERRTNSRGFSTTLVRNEFRQPTQWTAADGGVWQRKYEARRLQLVEDVDPLGVRTTYTYDAKGNLRQLIQAADTAEQRVVEMDVNALGQTSRIVFSGRAEQNGVVTPDAVWQVQYDAQGQVSQVTNPEGEVSQYRLDRSGNLVQRMDALGRTNRFEFDAHGNLLKATDALGRSFQYEYDGVGNLVRETDPRGVAVRSQYDTMNRQIGRINAVNGERQTSYEVTGRPIRSSDEDGRAWDWSFDGFLRLSRGSDAMGNKTSYGYDLPDGSAGSLGEPTRVVYPTFQLERRYDASERPSSETVVQSGAAGVERSTQSREYDKRGQVLVETDAYGKTRRYTHDLLGQRVRFTDAMGVETVTMYDVRGNLIEVKDGKGNTTRFEYDRVGRMVAETSPQGQKISYAYNAAGRLTGKTLADGSRVEYVHDSVDRLVEVKYSATSGGLLRRTGYTWDANGNMTGWSETDTTRPTAQQTVSAGITYDEANRKIGETVTYPTPDGSQYSMSYAQGRSAAGKKSSLTLPDGTKVDYSYSLHGELQRVAIPGEGTISVDAYRWFAPARVTLPGGSTQTRGHDGLLNLESFDGKTAGQQSFLELRNRYGKTSELKGSDRIDRVGNASSTVAYAYTYDDEIRLTGYARDTGGLFGRSTETYSLDAVANRTGQGSISGAWVYDANNRLKARGGSTRYEYDERGNLREKEEAGQVVRYVHDSSNRLVEVRDGSGRIVARYGYDALNRRAWKERYRGTDGQALDVAKRVYYLYADEGLIAESEQAIEVGTDGQVTGVTAIAPVVVTQYVPRPGAAFGTGMLAIKTRNAEGIPVVAYYHRDHLETPMMATDKAGRVVWSATYDPFGRATVTSPTGEGTAATVKSNLRLAGQYFDEETELHYNWHRFYDPNVGRYAQSDPIGLAGGLNTYAYVSHSPTNNIDPLGLDCVAKNGSVTCTPPGGPTVVFPRPPDWPDTINDSSWKYHAYNIPVPLNGANADCVMRGVVANPTPGNPSAATPGGTPNNATPPMAQKLFDAVDYLSSFGNDPGGYSNNPVLSYSLAGGTVVVNVTQPGHKLHPGYVARTIIGSEVNNFGEGLGLLQSDFSPVKGPINGVWVPQTGGLVASCECSK